MENMSYTSMFNPRGATIEMSFVHAVAVVMEGSYAGK